MTTLYTTGQDLKALVLSRAGDLASNPEWGNECETYIQTSYITILADFPWLFARKNPPGVLNTVAEITTGSVTLTTDSTAGTFSNAPAVSVAGRKLSTDAEGIVCRISAHTAGATGFTLDAAYPGEGGSGLAYVLFQDEYALATDFLIPAAKSRFLRDCHGSYEMDLISPNQLDVEYPYPSSGTAARRCALIREQTVRIAPYPTAARRYEYEYVYRPTALTFDGGVSDALVIEPPEDRIVVAYAAAGEIMVDMNDDRWASLAAAAPEKLKQMKARQRKLLRSRVFVRRQSAVGAGR